PLRAPVVGDVPGRAGHHQGGRHAAGGAVRAPAGPACPRGRVGPLNRRRCGGHEVVRPAHIDGMTMQTLPVSGGAAAPDAPELTSRWERFENAGRDRATRAGRPVPRLAMPGALPMQAPSADGTHSGPPVVLLVTGR